MPRLVSSLEAEGRERQRRQYLTEACPVANPCEVDLLASLLELDPTKRPDAAAGLEHANGVECADRRSLNEALLINS